MKESTEELKAITNNKPDGATHIDDDLIYIKDGAHSCDYFDNECGAWRESLQTPLTRSLSDMEEIIELREFTAGLQLSVSDEVKANELLGVDDGY